MEEGAERTDEAGELNLPADEVLSELDVELPGSSADAEADEEEAEPLELDLADVDLEE